MRRKLAYSNPVLTDTVRRFGMLPKGDWHVSKTGGILFVGDTDWNCSATLGETLNEAEFHLDKTTSMLVQVQDKTTCRDIAIESKPAYDIYVVGGGGFRASSPPTPHPTKRIGGGGMRIRNLYNPPTMKDREAVTPWAPAGMTASSKTTDEGCEITVTGDVEQGCWLNPPRPKPDGLVNVVWQLKDGSYLISDNNNLTVRFYAGVTVLTRLCGFDDRSLVTLLQNAGLPLVFAATDRPY